MAKRYHRVRHRRSSDISWKSVKKRFQIKKRLRRFSLALLVFLGVLLTLGAIYTWYYLARPFARAAGTLETDISWGGTAPLNLLWLEVEEIESETSPLTNLAVIALNPTLNRFTIINLPLEHKVYLPTQGKQPLKAIYGVGNLLDPKQWVLLTSKNVSYLLGIPIDGYLLVGRRGVQQLSGLLDNPPHPKDYLSIKNLTFLPQMATLGHHFLRTNLSLNELGRLILFLWGVRSDKVVSFALKMTDFNDLISLDRQLRPYVEDKTFAKERLKIQILNGTLKPGLASFAARMVRNLGGEVIRVGNYERQDLTKGFLVLNESGSHTAQRLAYIFGVVDSRPPRTSSEKRADITLILGLENYKKIF